MLELVVEVESSCLPEPEEGCEIKSALLAVLQDALRAIPSQFRYLGLRRSESEFVSESYFSTFAVLLDEGQLSCFLQTCSTLRSTAAKTLEPRVITPDGVLYREERRTVKILRVRDEGKENPQPTEELLTERTVYLRWNKEAPM